MTFKKLLIILMFAVSTVMIMLLGTSYAWYSFSNAVTSFNNVQTMSDNIDLAVVFTNDNNIGTTVGVPIASSDVATLSEKTNFTITPSSTLLSGRTVAMQISIINLSLDSALKNTTDLKYSLLQTVDGTTTTIASGNFSGVNEDTLILLPMTVITNLDTTYSYEFRLWLEETNASQNNLMGKKITGNIKISTAFK